MISDNAEFTLRTLSKLRLSSDIYFRIRDTFEDTFVQSARIRTRSITPTLDALARHAFGAELLGKAAIQPT